MLSPEGFRLLLAGAELFAGYYYAGFRFQRQD